MPQDSLQRLYDGVSAHLDIGDYDTFTGKMQNPDSRKRFYDQVSQNLDIGEFTQFESKVSTKSLDSLVETQETENDTLKNQQTVYEDEGLQATKEQLTLNVENQKKELEQSQPQISKTSPIVKQKGFISKMGESFKRTEQSSKLDQLTFLAATNFPGAPSIEEVDTMYQEYVERVQQDPIKGDNWLETMLIGTAGLLGSFGIAAKEGGIQGATAGMSGAAIAGTLSPLAPLAEEVFTIPAAGALGFQAGSSIFFAQQGAGSVIRNLRSRGVDSDTSLFLGAAAGVPYALLEQLQFTKLIPKSLQKEASNVVTKTLAKQLSNLGVKYGKDLATNVAQEDLQLITTTIAEELGVYLDNQVKDGEIEQTTFDKFFKELAETTKQTTMSLVPLSGVRMSVDLLNTQDVVSGLVDSQQEIEDQSIEQEIEQDVEKQPETEVLPKTEPVEAPVEVGTQVEPDQVSPEIEPEVESEVDLDRDAPTPIVTPEITEEVIAEETDESISDRFNEGDVDQKIFTEKVDEAALSDRRLPGGSVRNVYNIDGKVIKVAKSPRGLEQNISMGFGDQSILGTFVPELFEVGKDYIVTENVPRNDTETRKFLKPLQKFTAQDWNNKTAELQDTLRELGLDKFLDYEVLWNDFIAHRNWGQRENGEFVLIDEGALNKNVTSTSVIPDWAKQEWEDIKRMRRQQRSVARAQESQAREQVSQTKPDAETAGITPTEGEVTTDVRDEKTNKLNDQYQNATDAQDAAQAMLLRDDLAGQQRRKAQESFDRATKLVEDLELEGKTNDLQIDKQRTETDAIKEVVSFFEQTDPDIDYQVTLDETRTIYDAVEDPKNPETLESALLAVENAGKELEGVSLSEVELTGENYREARDSGLVDVIKINKGADVGTVVEERSETWYSSQEDNVEGFDNKIGELREQYFKDTKETDDTTQSNKEWFSDRVKDYVFSKKTRKNLPSPLVKILDKFKKYAKELTNRAKKFGDYVKKNKVSTELQDMLQRSVTEGIQVQPTKQKAPGYEMRRKNATSRERARRDEQTRRRTLKQNYEDLKAGNTTLYDEQVAEQIEREERTGKKSPIYAGSINVDKQMIDDAMKSFQIGLSQLQPKKKVTWDETGRLRDEILADIEKSAKVMLKGRRGMLNSVELDVLRHIHVNGIAGLQELAQAGADQAAYKAVENYFNDVFAILSNVSSEYGRGLNILKRDVAYRRVGEAVAKLENGMSEYQKSEFAKINRENPLELMRFAKSLEKPLLMDYVYEFWYNSILSGIPTHLVNIGSNTLWMSYQIPQRALSGSVDALITKFTGKERSRYVNEIIPMMAGMKEGFKKGRKRAKEVMKTGEIPIELDTKWDLELGATQGAWARSPNEYMRLVAPAVSIVGRALRAMDVWANSIAFDADINAQAKRIANQEGLKGEVAQNRETELRRRPSNDMVEKAKSFAKYTTFMDNPGRLAQGLAKFRSDFPGGRFFVPFVNTLANITKRGYEFVPGLGLMKKKNLQGKGQYQDSASDIIAKQTVGTILALTLLNKYEDEEVTGAVPKNKAKREAFYRQGKLPWSIKFGDKWISYRRIEPFNTVLASVTIAAETMKKYSENEIDKMDEAFFELVSGLKQNFIDSTMLKGISDLFDDKKDKNFFQRLPGTFIPYSSFWRSMNRSLEVNMEGSAKAREVKNIADGFTQNWLSGTLKLKPKLNVWGEEIVLEGGVLRQWLPFKYRSKNPDVLETELERIGVYPAVPEKKYNYYDPKIKKYVKLDIPDKIYDEARIYYGNRLKKQLTPIAEKSKNKSPESLAIVFDKIIRKNKKGYFGQLRKNMESTIEEYNKKNYPKDS